MKATVLLVALAAAPAAAQSINIDFGTPGTAPSPAYAAAGRAGVWNSLGVLGGTPVPLVGLWGQPTGATIYNAGGSAMLAYDNPGTTGDDAALMDDMFLSYNNPTDLCLYIQGLQNGTYEVVVYAMSPDSATILNRVRVDNAAPGPTWVGGSWPGQHIQGTTYSRHTITITNGLIYPHCGEYGANYRSGINGLQIMLVGECYPNCDGSVTAPVLNVADFTCFLQKFAAGNGYANCDGSVTPPALNVADFTCFLQKFAAGCP